MTPTFFRSVLMVSLCAAAIPCAAAKGQMQTHAGEVPAAALAGLQWRDVGPMRGGRSFAVAGVASQPDTFYFGAVGGGVWKTENAGRTWTPIADQGIPIGSIGAIAVAPSDPNVVYVGTGEPDIRSQHSYGIGMYKSTDAGKTWTHIGLENSQHIGRIVVDPASPPTRRMLARSTLRSTRRIRECCTRRCGQRAGRRGLSMRRRICRGAGCISRPTAAITGRS
jgi:hypothetical protein